MAGFGQTPLGIAPFGLGTPADAPAEITGDIGTRYINTLTRDYQINSVTNQYAQMPTMRQRVFFSIAESRGSSTVRPNDGVLYPDKMGDGFERRVEASIREALFQLTDVEKAIRVDRVIVSKRNSQRAHILVQWTDLSTREQDGLEVPLG